MVGVLFLACGGLSTTPAEAYGGPYGSCFVGVACVSLPGTLAYDFGPNESYGLSASFASVQTVYALRNRQQSTQRPVLSYSVDVTGVLVDCRKLVYDNRAWVNNYHWGGYVAAQRIAPTVGPRPSPCTSI